ncbi:MAG: hypothetical protein M1138_00905 [Candidatus Thermoplasmatota archaeon]|nr:hypothetical protein [Candidatus Thermoplasmatota archaeon]
MPGTIYDRLLDSFDKADFFIPLLMRLEYRSIITTARQLSLSLETADDFAFARYAYFTYESYLGGFYKHEVPDAEEKAMELTRIVLGLFKKQLGFRKEALYGFRKAIDVQVAQLISKGE